MHSNEFVSIVLAAGQAKRMGTIKQLLMHQGKTMLQTVIDNISILKNPLIVVLGAYSGSIAKSVKGHNLTIVVNKNWEEGIGSSIRFGLTAAINGPSKPKAVIIALADQPSITSDHFTHLFERGQASNTIVATKYQNIIGVPAYFPSRFFDDLQGLHGDIGARHLFHKMSCQVMDIVFEPAALDIDTKQDWQDFTSNI